MRVYDCDDASQFADLEKRCDNGALSDRNLLQVFGPDELTEAHNRGFRAVHTT